MLERSGGDMVGIRRGGWKVVVVSRSWEAGGRYSEWCYPFPYPLLCFWQWLVISAISNWVYPVNGIRSVGVCRMPTILRRLVSPSIFKLLLRRLLDIAACAHHVDCTFHPRAILVSQPPHCCFNLQSVHPPTGATLATRYELCRRCISWALSCESSVCRASGSDKGAHEKGVWGDGSVKTLLVISRGLL